MTHVTRRTRRTRKPPTKSTIPEHTKINFWHIGGPKFFQIKHFFFTQKFFQIQSFFGPKILFRPNIVFRPNIFSDTKFFFHPKFFSDPTFFWDPKSTLRKMIFGGIKQSFWTWAFLNCLAQSFYLNWSLTLKTKSCWDLLLKCGMIIANFIECFFVYG